MIRDLGAVNIASQHPSLLEDVSMEVILQEDPDIIPVTTMGDSERAMEAFGESVCAEPGMGETDGGAKRPGWCCWTNSCSTTAQCQMGEL